MLRSDAPLSRRSTVGLAGLIGAGAVVGLTGCGVDLDALRAPEATPSSPPPSRDRQLVDQVVGELRRASRGTPQPFRHLHTVHLEALGSPKEPTGGKRPSREVVRRREVRLPDTLTRASLRAEAPDLIELFASMVAAQRQLLARHPEVFS